MIVIVPSRGRPQRAESMVASIRQTAAGPVRVVVAVDPDDPTLDEYRPMPEVVVLPARLGYTATLNAIAREVWDEEEILGAFGDDVLFQTPGWDDAVRAALTTPGIAYPDDLVHGKAHPTAVFMSAVIARSLGWLALPATSHQWADDGWKRLGEETKTLRFLEGVVVEHMHPAVGKGAWDETYASVFDDARAKRDYEGFEAWLSGAFANDVARVRAVL